MSRKSLKNCASLLGAVLVFLCVSLQTQQVGGANILGMFTSSSPSHLIIHMSVVKALAERGHNVTVVSTLKPTITHENINTIVIPPTEEQKEKKTVLMSKRAADKNNIILMLRRVFYSMTNYMEEQADVMLNKRFTALYENPDTKFDLVIVGYVYNDFQLGMAGKFNCPVIVNWLILPNALVNRYVGNPNEVAYVPNVNLQVKPGEVMNFKTRIRNVVTATALQFINLVLDYRMQGYYTRLFPSTNFPTYSEMRKNVSLLFCNSASISEGPIRPDVPALVEIGGIQIKDKPDPLPKDIADFLEASKVNGAILFSLGSNLLSSQILKPEAMDAIFTTLSNLKQNVIWKWDDLKHTPGMATNIRYKKWLPQDDILAHPNIKLFITHAGKGGVTESQYHGVPMVALPVYGDQHGNAQKMAVSGYGLHLNILELEAETFKEAITEVLNNSSYATNVRRFSQLYRDRPITAKESVVFWTEYVLRHHGAAHMQSPLVHMNAIQSLSLDVIGVIGLTLYVAWRLLKCAVKFLYRKICKNSNQSCEDKHQNKDKKVKKQ